METRNFATTRWPGRELELRRRSASDPGFDAVLSDYEEACAAYRHWLLAEPADDRKIADYRRIVSDLEEEIETHLAAR